MKNWLKKFSKFCGLSSVEKLLCLKISFVLLFINISLFILPFSSFRKLYSFFIKQVIESYEYDEIYLIRIAYMTEYIGSFFSIKCLSQALAYRFLLRKDKRLVIKIGINTEKDHFEAHAWVEKARKVLIGERNNMTLAPLWDWSDSAVK